MKKMKESTRSFISSVISSDDNAWLGLDDTDVAKFRSPLEEVSDFDKDNLHLKIISLMRKPEYFQWTVKKLFGIELLTVQT